MKVSKYIAKQIKSITSSFIETSFQIEFNYVSDKNGVIRWEGFKNISFTLKNLSYDELYSECLKERAFNLKLIDGALIQFKYECNKNEIIRHRLTFYPNPNIERFQDDPEGFEDTHFGNRLFSEIYDRKVIVFPIRFDFDMDKSKYIEHDHSFSHLTLGNYKNCRIPVAKPFTPNKFILFILRSFYFDRFKEYYTNDSFKCSLNMDSLLTEEETKHLHLSY